VEDLAIYYSYWKQYRTGDSPEILDATIPYAEDPNYRKKIEEIMGKYDFPCDESFPWWIFLLVIFGIKKFKK
jgi:hypothetical protein